MKPSQKMPPNRDKIFLSWSKDLSNACALHFRSFFRHMGQGDRVFLSTHDLAGGDDFEAVLIKAIRETLVVFAFITKENAVSSRWMEYECSGVILATDETLLVPILVDLEPDELPEDSIWRKPLLRIQTVKIRDFGSLNKVLEKVRGKCGFDWAKDSGLPSKAIQKLCEDVSIHLAHTKDSSSDDLVVRAFRGSDREFASWAYQYHRVIHQARDLVVRISHQFKPMDNPNSALETIWDPNDKDPKQAPIIATYNQQLTNLLNAVQDAFRKTVSDRKALIWTCLRELRSNQQYYNVCRSSNYPIEGGDGLFTIPWPEDCNAVVRLRKTLDDHDDRWDDETDDEENKKIGPNCTIITHIKKKCWPPVREDHPNPYRKQSILGAVLLKKVSCDLLDPPEQARLWMILCVNSDTPDVFKPAHQRLLQGFNDAFSSVANVMLRCAASPPQSDGDKVKPAS